MPAERLPMRQVFEAFRLAFDQGRSQREIARALGLSQSTVNDYLRRFRGTGLPWPIPVELDEAAVEARLFTTSDAPAASGGGRCPTGRRSIPN
ncbi:MAG: helix-turn-helix domain-containing protein [Gemmatimonadaceae bacterium]|nr:helix-turn-helix domain-containing protein [Gemmatimonadaceae bacterium]